MAKKKRKGSYSAFIVAFQAELPLDIKLLTGLKTRNNKRDFFGGSFNPKTEDPKSAAIREFYEETNLPLHAGRVHTGESFSFKEGCIYIFSTIIHPSWKPILSREHKSWDWVSLDYALRQIDLFTPKAQAIITRLDQGVLF